MPGEPAPADPAPGEPAAGAGGLRQALLWLADSDPEVHGRALDVLVRRAPLEVLLASTRVGATLDARLHGARCLVRLAGRIEASKAGTVERWLLLEEGLRSPWGAHAEALLARAGLDAPAGARLLAEREAARAAYRAYLERAWTQLHDPAEAVAAAAAVGPAIVPHALLALADPPWLASQGWPRGPTVILQRMACWLLGALRPPEALPFLLHQVRCPSGALQGDVLAALHTLTGEAAFAAGADNAAQDRAWAHARAWWPGRREAHAPATRFLALAALREALAYLVARRGDPAYDARSEVGGTPPDPFVRLFEDLELLAGLPRRALPPAAADLTAVDAGAWLPVLTHALREVEAR